ncbi:MAG: response regulator [Candidatus Marinimicrobia bacterium]|nr:response regulator [Candidatus Neomarinimicrobiota bacterium]
MKSIKEMKENEAMLDKITQQCKESIHVINDKLTAIQVATENLWGEIDKKDFYCTQQIETIIRCVDTISSKIDVMQGVLASKGKTSIAEIPDEKGIKKRILIAEDDYDTGNIVKLFLERANMEVVTAKNGKIAFDAYQKDKFDMIISDIDMPEVNGKELREMIRKVDPEIPILFISGYDKEAAREAAGDDEKAFSLNKPFNQADLLRVIEKALF